MKDEPAQEREAFSELLSQIRDQVLKSSPKGDAYIQMVYQHAPEIMMILSRDENLRQQVKDLALEIQPLLESVVSNEAEFKKPRLEKTWIEKAIVVLDDVSKQEPVQAYKQKVTGGRNTCRVLQARQGKKFGRCSQNVKISCGWVTSDLKTA